MKGKRGAVGVVNERDRERTRLSEGEPAVASLFQDARVNVPLVVKNTVLFRTLLEDEFSTVSRDLLYRLLNT